MRKTQARRRLEPFCAGFLDISAGALTPPWGGEMHAAIDPGIPNMSGSGCRVSVASESRYAGPALIGDASS